MRVLHTIADFRTWRIAFPTHGVVTFVPTMGALHEGHASLVRAARELAGDGGKVLASIFVNPTQFGPAEDFGKYPRTLDADLALLMACGCDAVFVPTAAEIYPAHASQPITINPGPLSTVLEGAIRPGHFAGVCTVVAKLLLIAQPTHLFLGQKDYQQQLILRHMCHDLDFPVEVVTAPTIREPDGLAMSSRNRYLSAGEREKAAAIYKALTAAHAAYLSGQKNGPALEKIMQEILSRAGFEIQYAVVAESHTLAKVEAEITSPAVLLIAAKLGATRLIDNLVLNKDR